MQAHVNVDVQWVRHLIENLGDVTKEEEQTWYTRNPKPYTSNPKP